MISGLKHTRPSPKGKTSDPDLFTITFGYAEKRSAMISFAIELADAARDMVAAAALPDPETKPDRSFVTATDRAVEERLREMIADRFPQHGILGEEGQDVAPGANHVWVLDPIDGTAAFVAGVPVHGTLIALAQGGVPVLGLIDMHVTGQRWVGVVGQPTQLHHRGQINHCRTGRAQSLDRAILSASNPDFFSETERPALDALRKATAWMRLTCSEIPRSAR